MCKYIYIIVSYNQYIFIYIQYISRCKNKAKVDIDQSTPSLGHPYNAARSYLGKSARSGRSGAASTRPCSSWTWRKSNPTPRDRRNQVPQNRRSNKESCEHWNVNKEEGATEPKRWKEENGGMRNLVFLCFSWCSVLRGASLSILFVSWCNEVSNCNLFHSLCCLVKRKA